MGLKETAEKEQGSRGPQNAVDRFLHSLDGNDLLEAMDVLTDKENFSAPAVSRAIKTVYGDVIPAKAIRDWRQTHGKPEGSR